jgi:hypothetical protein
MIRQGEGDSPKYGQDTDYRNSPHNYLIAPRDLILGLILVFELGFGVGALVLTLVAR